MDESFATDIKAFPWFAAVGQPPLINPGIPIVIVGSQGGALHHCSEPVWEDVTLEARNRLTAFLSRRYRERDRQWNEITMEAKRKVVIPLEEQVWQPFAERRGLGKKFVDCVSWDVLAAIMEHEYRDCTGLPVFFKTLLGIYRAGHFPCGWQGEWPSGELLVW